MSFLSEYDWQTSIPLSQIEDGIPLPPKEEYKLKDECVEVADNRCLNNY